MVFIDSVQMNRSFLDILKEQDYYKDIEPYLFRGDPPSAVRKNLEKKGLSEGLSHRIVKTLWGLQNKKISSSLEDEFVDYLRSQGVSQEQDNSDFCPLQLAVGVLVETEHTDDFNTAVEIAKDHLAEDPGYYGKPKFTSEAIEHIADISEDSYEEGVVELDSSFRCDFFNSCRRALSSNRQFRLGPLCLCSATGWADGEPTVNELLADNSVVPFTVDGRTVWLVAEGNAALVETAERRLMILDENWDSPAVFVIAQLLGVPTEDVVPQTTEGAGEVSASKVLYLPILTNTENRRLLTEDLFREKLSQSVGVSSDVVDSWITASATLTPVILNNGRFEPVASSLSASVADFLNSALDQYSASQTATNYVLLASSAAPIEAETSSTLNFTAESYYKQAGIVPSFKDYVGYLQYTGEFKDYSSAHAEWKKLVDKLMV